MASFDSTKASSTNVHVSLYALPRTHFKPVLFLFSSYHDWKNDLFLIFRNCRTFNAPESKIVHDCEALQTIVYSVMRPTEKLLSRSNHAPSAVPTAN